MNVIRTKKELTDEQKEILIKNIEKLREYGFTDTQIIKFIGGRSRQIISAIVRMGLSYSIKYEKALHYNNLLTETIDTYESTRETKNTN